MGPMNHQTAGETSTDIEQASSRVPLTSIDGIKIVCPGCYVEEAVQNTINVLQTAGSLLLEGAKPDDVQQGIQIAEYTLEELLESIRSKPHGEGLPQDGIPVRVIPYVVSPKN